jgi:hypothetical protein
MSSYVRQATLLYQLRYRVTHSWWFQIYFHLLMKFWSMCKMILSCNVSLYIFIQNHPHLSLVFLFLEMELQICTVLLAEFRVGYLQSRKRSLCGKGQRRMAKVHHIWGPHSLIQRVLWLVHEGVKLTTHLDLMPRLRVLLSLVIFTSSF